MERGNTTRWLFIAVAIFLFATYGYPKLFGSKTEVYQPWTVNDRTHAEERAPEQTCTIDAAGAGGFTALLSSRGASLTRYELTDARYKTDRDQPNGLVTTTDLARMPLRTDLRMPGGATPEVAYDDLDWTLAGGDGKSCTFVYKTPDASIEKTIAATGKPYALEVTVKVQNLAPEPKKHRFAIEEDDYRKSSEVKGGFLKRQQELSEVAAATTLNGAQKTERHHPEDFKPSDFKKDKEFTAEQWRRAPGDARFVAVSSSYFTKVALPVDGPSPPAAETQIEERWDAYRYGENKEADPNYGYVYRGRLAWPEITLKPQESVTYRVLSYVGPKDRSHLAALPHDATEVLDLGVFSVIAQGLMWYLSRLHGVVGSWGVSIVLLTISVRLVLFPLSIAQIRSGAAMRKLKPEMDEINAKYKEDATQRGVALQELWRKNKVANPVVGCLPVMLQMPVWFALYTALQKTVELYHTPFLWFTDLTAPDKFFIIPIVLGASSFIQQKIMPPQGDLQQQKMMMYMMPAIFTVMMLFLPSGLGVYMLTNSLLGIGQQIAVERYLKAKAAR